MMFIKKEYSAPEFEVEKFTFVGSIFTVSGGSEVEIPGEDIEF